MSRRQPRITVGMPVYNGERYLRQAIESVLTQTYSDFELVISDNASSDATQAICCEYQSRDSRIIYLRNNENIGAAANYNQLFRRSTSEYFRWFNADDLSSPLLHEKCLAALLEQPDAALSYGRTEIIDGSGRFIDSYDDRLDLRQDSAADRFIEFFHRVGLTNAVYGLVRRAALEDTYLMGDGSFPAADTILMAELALRGKFIEIPETLFYRRMHEKASSWNRNDETIQQEFWLAKRSRFLMPTLKREHALWQAVRRASVCKEDRRRMRKYLVKRVVWAGGEISREALQALAGKVMANR